MSSFVCCTTLINGSLSSLTQKKKKKKKKKKNMITLITLISIHLLGYKGNQATYFSDP